MDIEKTPFNRTTVGSRIRAGIVAKHKAVSNIAPLVFRTQKEGHEIVKKKKETFNGDDQFWLSLLLRHPDADRKIGVGVKTFEKRMNAKRTGYEIWVVRLDGTKESFSCKTCVESRHATDNQNLRAAMRHAVKGQIDAFRIANSGQACSLCGGAFDVVDHRNPFFCELVRSFLIGEHPPKSFDSEPASHVAVFKVEDYAFAERWRAYHKDNAVLRVLCGKCNSERPYYTDDYYWHEILKGE